MDDLSRHVFELGAAINHAQAEAFRQAEKQHRVVYLLFHGEVVMGVCGTRRRADQEAEDIGHALNTVIRIEPRMVHL